MRPSSITSAASSSSSLYLLAPSSRSKRNDHPPCLKLSAPPGSSMTPSSDMNSVTTILPTSVSSLLAMSSLQHVYERRPPLRQGEQSFFSGGAEEGHHQAVEDVRLGDQAFGEAEAAHGRHQDGAAADDDIGAGFLQSGVE